MPVGGRAPQGAATLSARRTGRSILDAVEQRLRRQRGRLLGPLRGDLMMVVLAALTGLGTGLLAVALIRTIALAQRVAFGTSAGTVEILLVPAAGALVAGMLIARLVPEAARSGIVQVMATLALHGGRFRTVVPFGSVAATGVALGTGASGGREAPIVLIGGSLGSLLGRLLAVGEDRMRSLVGAGVAAGIGASFNAPIGGMLFAIELIVGTPRVRSMQSIVVSSVVASVTARQILGPEPFFGSASSYRLEDPRELLLYAVLGVVAWLVGHGYVAAQLGVGAWFQRLRAPLPLRLGLGGLAVGAVAVWVPEVLGTGGALPPVDGVREPIQAMLDGRLGGAGYRAAGTLLLLLGAKAVATLASVGSGNAVGSFAPLLFLGAALGGAAGHVAEALQLGGVQPGAFALVGMAAVFGSAARAPLTAIVLIFEMTGDYDLVLPLMLATGIATILSDRFAADGMYGRILRSEHGIVYAEPDDVDIMQTVAVGEIMTAEPDTVGADLTLDELRDAFVRTRHHGFPVVEDGRLLGVVTLSDLEAAGTERAGASEMTVADICTRHPATVTPADPVFRALRRMAALDVGRIPVVDAEDHGRLVGLLRRSDVVQAYRRAVTRSLGSQQRQEASRLRDLAGVHFVELGVERGAPAAGRMIRDVAWPERTILTSIRRADELVMPHGDTVLEPGDEVVVLTSPDAAATVRALLSSDGGA